MLSNNVPRTAIRETCGPEQHQSQPPLLPSPTTLVLSQRKRVGTISPWRVWVKTRTLTLKSTLISFSGSEKYSRGSDLLLLLSSRPERECQIVCNLARRFELSAQGPSDGCKLITYRSCSTVAICMSRTSCWSTPGGSPDRYVSTDLLRGTLALYAASFAANDLLIRLLISSLAYGLVRFVHQPLLLGFLHRGLQPAPGLIHRLVGLIYQALLSGLLD